MPKKKSKLLSELTWRDLKFCGIITDGGTDASSTTGEWRWQRPVVDKEKCNNCGLCWLFCPDSTMIPLGDGYYEPDLVYCKGCGICAKECPKRAILMIEEKA
jgi:pyruvate ferredoxin oxidoreductase delta subunit